MQDKSGAFFFNAIKEVESSIGDPPEILMKGLKISIKKGHVRFYKFPELLQFHCLGFLVDLEFVKDVICELFGQIIHVAIGNLISQLLRFEHKLRARIPIVCHNLLVGLRKRTGLERGCFLRRPLHMDNISLFFIFSLSSKLLLWRNNSLMYKDPIICHNFLEFRFGIVIELS